MKKVVLVVLAVLAAGTAQAGVFTENFESGWANDSTSGYLYGGDAQTNGWIFPSRTYGAQVWNVATASGNSYIGCYRPASMPAVEAGKQHGLDVSSATSMDMSFQAITSGNGQGYTWLSNGVTDGYGIYTWMNKISVIKMVGNAGPYAPWGESAALNAGWKGLAWDGSSHNANVAASDDPTGWVTYHLKLEQAAAGTAVKLTVWYTGTNADTSYASPAIQITDSDPLANTFNATPSGAILDLSTLGWVGFSATSAGADFIKFDNITVATVPEPLTLSLLGLGGLLLRRRSN